MNSKKEVLEGEMEGKRKQEKEKDRNDWRRNHIYADTKRMTNLLYTVPL